MSSDPLTKAPVSGVESPLSRLKWLFGGLFVVVLYGAFLIFYGQQKLPPDTWSLYELSQSVFRDFYRHNTWRQFQTLHPYSTAFPPLFPLLVGALNGLLDQGMRTPYWLNFAIMILAALVAERWLMMMTKVRGLGFLCMCFLLIGVYRGAPSAFGTELINGTVYPLALVWLMLGWSFAWSAHNERRLVDFIGVGVCAGLCLMTRFDLMALVVPSLAIACLAWRTAWSKLVAMFVSAGLVCAPYMAYSYHHFGKMWATDNKIVALSATKVHVLYIFPPGHKTIGDAPVQWLMKVLSSIKPFVLSFGMGSFRYVLFWPVVVLALWWVRRSWVATKRPWHPESDQALRFVLSLLLGASPLVAASIVTGYIGQRYWTPVYLLLFVAVLLVCRGAWLQVRAESEESWLIRAEDKLKWAGIGLGVVGVVVLSVAIRPATNTVNTLPKKLQALSKCMSNKQGVMFLRGDHKAARFGAVTGTKTFFYPPNLPVLPEKTRRSFYKRFKVRYLYFATKKARQEKWLPPLTPVKGCTVPLYQISLKTK